jgi:hypothetical protein
MTLLCMCYSDVDKRQEALIYLMETNHKWKNMSAIITVADCKFRINVLHKGHRHDEG